MHHNGYDAYIDHKGIFNLKNSTSNPSTPAITFKMKNSTNQGTNALKKIKY